MGNAETNGLKLLSVANISNNRVSKGLEDGTQDNYERMLVFWNE